MTSVNFRELIRTIVGDINKLPIENLENNSQKELTGTFEQMQLNQSFSFQEVIIEEVSIDLPAYLYLTSTEDSTQKMRRLMIDLSSPLIPQAMKKIGRLKITFSAKKIV